MATYNLLTNGHTSGYGYVRDLPAWVAALMLVCAVDNVPEQYREAWGATRIRVYLEEFECSNSGQRKSPHRLGR